MSRISDLDLRPEDAKNPELLWNWPKFPPRSGEFIETGKWPRHSIKVIIRADVSQFKDAMAQMEEALKKMMAVAMPITIIDHLYTAKKESHWAENCIYIGLILLAVVFITGLAWH